MQTSNSSRATILNAIRANLPKQEIEHPQIPVFHRASTSLKSEFEIHLQKAGGAAHDAASVAEVEAKLMSLHPNAKVICSAVREIAGTRRAEAVHDPHELADVDVGIVRAQFGVA
jgi:L-lactate dehydrogenase complex protein LldG